MLTINEKLPKFLIFLCYQNNVIITQSFGYKRNCIYDNQEKVQLDKRTAGILDYRNTQSRKSSAITTWSKITLFTFDGRRYITHSAKIAQLKKKRHHQWQWQRIVVFVVAAVAEVVFVATIVVGNK